MFKLDDDYRPKRRKVNGENNPKSRQAVLFAGMHLLPGQADLFPTDGKSLRIAAARPKTPAARRRRDEQIHVRG